MARGTKTISQRIALEGGKAIQDDLKKLGKAGEKAFAQIQDAADATQGPSASFGRAMQKLRGELDKVRKAGQQVRDEVGRLGGAFGSLGNASATVAKRIALVGAAAGAAGAAVFALAKSGAAAADEAAKSAAEFGLTIQEYGRLSFAAQQGGASADDLRSAMGRLNRQIVAANEGSKGAVALFDQLGVRVRDANGQLRPTSDILNDIADRFSELPDGAAKSALAMELMGRSGARLVPLLNGGRDGLRSLGDEAERLGRVFTKEQGRIAEGMNDALARLTDARRGVSNQIGLLFAPYITRAADELTAFLNQNRQALISLTEAGIKRAIPVMNDLINALSGNDAAVQNLWILQARDAVLGFADSVSSAVTGIIIPVYEAVVAVADKVAAGINRLFGTNFDGKALLAAAAVAKLIGLFGLFSAALKLAWGFLRLGYVAIVELLGALPALKNIIIGISAAFAGLAKTIAVGFRRQLFGILVAARLTLGTLTADVGKAARAIGAGLSVAMRGVGAAVVGAGALIARGFATLLGGVGVAVRGVLTVLAGLLSWPALLGAAIGTAASLIYIYWDEIEAGARQLWARLAPVLQAGAESVATFAQSAADRVTAAFEARRQRFISFWAGVIVAGRNAADAVARAWGIAVPILSALWDVVVERATRAFEQVKRLFGEGFEALWEGIKDAAAEVWDFIADGFRGLGEDIVAIFGWVLSRIQSIANRIKSAAAAVKAAASSLFGGDDSNGTTNPLAMNTGGHVRGPGTATSDSIPARLSDGEFVQRTKAVRYYGVGLMDALNRMRIKRDDLFAALRGRRKYATGGLVEKVRRVREPIQKFATGGLVRPQITVNPAAMLGAMTTGIMPVPGFAQGGLAMAPAGPQGRPVTIQLPGGEAVEGLMATDDAIARIQRAAARGKVASAGRKPGWHGGGL